ncbi:MAG: hypothetical protein DDT32_00425 [Syntrophomonadaceae bacterium]|nr:hypothetical protein [Bacillota bacterium]MBT9146688.1 hypothetical protein [Bacillota bacterium]MBT9158666.1 hypothetical protein [Bacillota bacterium]
MTNHDDKLVFSVPEAAARLQISRGLCYSLVKQKVLPSVKLGARRLVIPKLALEEFLNRQGGVGVD